jgi:4-diphosphocytidyl-2-C-methyl-D-erythritol kinase
MRIQRQSNGWEIVVPAKLNLFLEVVGRRPNGYHDLDTIMTAVSLCDRLRFQPTLDREIQLSIIPLDSNGFETLSPDDQAWNVPADHSNLVVRAAESIRQTWRIDAGLKIELAKAIPSQAGLGGGSADAAAAIVGSMLAWRKTFDTKLAGRVASDLGSDINFFLEGKASNAPDEPWVARCTGRGELVEPLHSSQRMQFVVFHPAKGCSTKDIFRRLAEEDEGKVRQIQSCDAWLQYLSGNSNSLPPIFNRLQVPASKDNPSVERLVVQLSDELGVSRSGLTGSGSAVFGLASSHDQALEWIRIVRNKFKVRAYAVKSWGFPTILEQLRAIGIE